MCSEWGLFTLARRTYSSKDKSNCLFRCASTASCAFILFYVWKGTICYIGFYLLFSNLLFEIICSITDLAASFLLPSAGISGEGDEDYLDKADAQSRFLWRD